MSTSTLRPPGKNREKPEQQRNKHREESATFHQADKERAAERVTIDPPMAKTTPNLQHKLAPYLCVCDREAEFTWGQVMVLFEQESKTRSVDIELNRQLV